jgi:hypothetical protein
MDMLLIRYAAIRQSVMELEKVTDTDPLVPDGTAALIIAAPRPVAPPLCPFWTWMVADTPPIVALLSDLWNPPSAQCTAHTITRDVPSLPKLMLLEMVVPLP